MVYYQSILIPCMHLFGVQIQTQVVITKRLLSQLYGQTDAALNSLSSTLLARQAVSPNICLKLPILFLIALDHFRKAKLCTELLQTVAKVDSGFSQFRFRKNLDSKSSKKSTTMQIPCHIFRGLTTWELYRATKALNKTRWEQILTVW